MNASATALKKYTRIAKSMARKKGVSFGNGKKGFGANALFYENKIFAMLTSKGIFVVKLPAQEVKALTEQGQGSAMIMKGKPLKEWFTAGDSAEMSWDELAEVSLRFLKS